MEDASTYEIFKKELDNTMVPVDSVKGLAEAQKAIERLNEKSPGEYFVFDAIKDKVIDPAHPSIEKDPFAL